MERSQTNRWIDTLPPDAAREIHRALALEEELLAIKGESDGEIIADILQHIKVDMETIVSAILLVVLCAKPSARDSIQNIFSPAVVTLANEAYSLYQEERTWLSKLDDLNESTARSHHMMLLSMMHDVRVVFILLAYQLLSLRKIAKSEPEAQRQMAREAKYIFAPLANRLGIGQLKWELEDYAFRYLKPDDYKFIAKSLEEKRVDREQYMERIVTQLRHAIEDAGIKAEVYGRPKHIYSIWRKMQNKHLKFSDLYDVRAVRVLVDDLSSCYNVLSVVHGIWQFIPEEYDDYIAAPKSNNYQSLHTAVIGPEEKTVEIQIRTHEMHEHAEMGVAAHWRYKEGGKTDTHVEDTIDALRGLVDGHSADHNKLDQVSHSK
ncbi:MAG: HD domain-containing protein, partial [Gammaproteobacteria bacterium]|nr:HD domain-containing protein [Gammaproteobacteria bacterium]